MMGEKCYMAIDLKSFYASCECVARGLDPLRTNLVVADPSRTEKTICLAVSPSLKAHGIGGRARLFEVIARLKEVNATRRRRAPHGRLVGSSYNDDELKSNPSLSVDYITAPPRMRSYMECSARIYDIYLRYIAPEDIHVYSVDEVFIDATPYLSLYKSDPHTLARRMIKDVLTETGITATCGIGTNLYLCKVAMDIEAKHAEPDEDGVRIAYLDERSYREKLWSHTPITDFWRVGRGYAEKLRAHGINTMGEIARRSLYTGPYGEDFFYKLFGVNAELLIDHAWGVESCTMADIKAYRPSTSSLGSGQVLHCAYGCEGARLIVREMIDALSLDLIEKRLVTDKIVLTVGYDKDSPLDGYEGEITTDFYGRAVPKHAHGTASIGHFTSSSRELTRATLELFDRIIDKKLLVRRINVAAINTVEEGAATEARQLDFATLIAGTEEAHAREDEERSRERRLQEAVLKIKKKHGKNAIIKGTSLEEGATAIDRNRQIGGHEA